MLRFLIPKNGAGKCTAGSRVTTRAGDRVLQSLRPGVRWSTPIGIRFHAEPAQKSEPLIRSDPAHEGGGGLHSVLTWQDAAGW